MVPRTGLNAAEERKTYTGGGNLIVVKRITVDSVKHNSFIQYYRSNMFRPNGPSSDWQEWKIKYTVFSGN